MFNLGPKITFNTGNVFTHIDIEIHTYTHIFKFDSLQLGLEMNTHIIIKKYSAFEIFLLLRLLQRINKYNFHHVALRLFITLHLFCVKNGSFIALQNEVFHSYTEGLAIVNSLLDLQMMVLRPMKKLTIVQIFSLYSLWIDVNATCKYKNSQWQHNLKNGMTTRCLQV